MVYTEGMKTVINKLTVPLTLLAMINMIGMAYHFNYEGALIGSIIGMMVAFLANEIRAKFD
jgi:glucose-6-phosphate-specific signal transduction histidine kinase